MSLGSNTSPTLRIWASVCPFPSALQDRQVLCSHHCFRGPMFVGNPWSRIYNPTNLYQILCFMVMKNIPITLPTKLRPYKPGKHWLPTIIDPPPPQKKKSFHTLYYFYNLFWNDELMIRNLQRSILWGFLPIGTLRLIYLYFKCFFSFLRQNKAWFVYLRDLLLNGPKMCYLYLSYHVGTLSSEYTAPAHHER